MVRRLTRTLMPTHYTVHGAHTPNASDSNNAELHSKPVSKRHEFRSSRCFLCQFDQTAISFLHTPTLIALHVACSMYSHVNYVGRSFFIRFTTLIILSCRHKKHQNQKPIIIIMKHSNTPFPRSCGSIFSPIGFDVGCAPSLLLEFAPVMCMKKVNVNTFYSYYSSSVF